MASKIISLQFALFFEDRLADPEKIFKDLNAKTSNLFDGAIQRVPIPDQPQLPPEIPVAVLNSKDQTFSCNLSRSRFDFFFKNQKLALDTNSEEELKTFKEHVDLIAKYVLSKRDIKRFGMVARFFHEVEDPVTCIQEKYFKNIDSELTEISFRFNKKTPFRTFQMNDVIDISAGEMVIQTSYPVVKKGIIIQRDINNDLNEIDELSIEELNEISENFSFKLNESEIEGLVK